MLGLALAGRPSPREEHTGRWLPMWIVIMEHGTLFLEFITCTAGVEPSCSPTRAEAD
jgi:hypothetical protein